MSLTPRNIIGVLLFKIAQICEDTRDNFRYWRDGRRARRHRQRMRKRDDEVARANEEE